MFHISGFRICAHSAVFFYSLAVNAQSEDRGHFAKGSANLKEKQQGVKTYLQHKHFLFFEFLMGPKKLVGRNMVDKGDETRILSAFL